jgi:hypothetical protein
MKRLIKKSIMDLEVFKGTIGKLGTQGRKILKELEEYKFQLEQAGRIIANDPELTQKIVQKRKSLDQIAGQVYSIVFDIENIDITQAYEQQQMMVNNPGMNQPMDGAPMGQPGMGQPGMGQPPMGQPPVGDPGMEGGDMGGGAPMPSGGEGGSSAPSSEEGGEVVDENEGEEGGEEMVDEEDLEEPIE